MNEQNYTKPAKGHTFRNIAVGAVLFAAGCGVGGAGSSDTPAASPAPTVTATVTAEAPKESATRTASPAATSEAPAPTTTEWSDGVYEIGSTKDIKPGAYKARVDSGFGCYIEQTTDASGEFESIVSNDILDGKSGYVTIVAKANYVTISGCTLTPKG